MSISYNISFNIILLTVSFITCCLIVFCIIKCNSYKQKVKKQDYEEKLLQKI